MKKKKKKTNRVLCVFFVLLSFQNKKQFAIIVTKQALSFCTMKYLSLISVSPALLGKINNIYRVVRGFGLGGGGGGGGGSKGFGLGQKEFIDIKNFFPYPKLLPVIAIKSRSKNWLLCS